VVLHVTYPTNTLCHRSLSGRGRARTTRRLDEQTTPHRDRFSDLRPRDDTERRARTTSRQRQLAAQARRECSATGVVIRGWGRAGTLAVGTTAI